MKKLPIIALFLLMPLIASAWWPSATDVTNIVNSFGFLKTIPPNTNGIPPGMVTNNAPATITVTNAGVATAIKSNSVTTPSLFSSSIVSSNTVTTNLTVSGTFSAAVPTTLLAGSNFLNGILLNQQGVDTIVLNSSGTPYYGAIGNPSPQVWGLGHATGSTPLSSSWTPDILWYAGGVSLPGTLQVVSNLSTFNLIVTNSSSVGTVNTTTLNVETETVTNNVSVGGTASIVTETAGNETVTNSSSVQGGITVKNLTATNAPIFLNGAITNGFMVFLCTTSVIPPLDTNHIYIATQTNAPGKLFVLSNTVWFVK